MPKLLVCLAVAGLLLPSGCSHSTGGVAPSTIPLAPGGYEVLERVHGSDCAIRLPGIIPVSGGNETRRAVESALSKAPEANALVNVTADSFSQFWILFSRHCTEVFGTAVQVR